MPQLARFGHYSLLISALGLTGACSSTLNIEDKNVLGDAAYFEKKVNGRVTFGVSRDRVKGDGTQTLGDSQEFNIGVKNIDGPANIDHEYSLETRRVYTNIKIKNTDYFNVNLVTGLARTALELKTHAIDSTQQKISFKDKTTGLTFGAELNVPLNRYFSFKARGLGTNFYFPDDDDITYLIDFDASLYYHDFIWEQLRSFVGIYSQSFSYRERYPDTRINIDVSGVRAGLSFNF